MVRNSVLSSTRRRGSISFVSTTNPCRQARRNLAHQGAPPRRAKVNEAGGLILDKGLGPISRFYFASKYQRPRTLFLVLKTDHRQLSQRAHPGSPPDFLS